MSLKKIEIELTDQQYLDIKNEIERCSKLNVEEATLTGFRFVISEYLAGLSNLTFEMQNEIDLGYVDWKFTDSE